MDPLFISALVLGIGLLLYSKLAMIEGRIKRQEKLLERLLKHEQFETPISDEVLGLVRKEKEVQAVKEARERFGFSLLEAKQYVDQLKNETTK
ncbi:ribosomal protein L7/L12 [Sporosarcina luteola]|nr:ribosomal protein L7/L12 [Sporosarcina luteola]